MEKWTYKGKEFTRNDIPDGAYGFVYLIEYPNGKKYVGRKKFDIHKNWVWYCGSGKLVLRYINKHGTDGIKRTILSFQNSYDEQIKAEEDVIIAHNAVESKDYYNLVLHQPGTDGYRHSQEVIDRIAKKNTGHVKSQETIEKHRAKVKGVPKSKEHNKKVSLANSKKPFTIVYKIGGRQDFLNQKKAMEITGIPETTINQWLTGKRDFRNSKKYRNIADIFYIYEGGKTLC